jgi:hypothetical protein
MGGGTSYVDADARLPRTLRLEDDAGGSIWRKRSSVVVRDNERAPVEEKARYEKEGSEGRRFLFARLEAGRSRPTWSYDPALVFDERLNPATWDRDPE